ncbi:MAG: type I-MYXAN CRISPR-associated protein Cas6/Cmx6 [Pyrinomonadaceae bacterium MAG19_C2-C3]|nr:type I-MYXAN CRISPR-associated protein Cas6/Cmx6 [Pyrinomonadaceae bacterium MAG19_C2-C3]
MPREAFSETTYNDRADSTSQQSAPPHIIVRFPVSGRTLPADHGYALYGALARKLPALHETRWLGIELISGIAWGQGIIALPNRNAALKLRLPADHFGAVLPLAGQRLDIGGHPITLGIPIAHPLTPAASLYARFVTIKKFTEPEPFLEAAQRQIEELGITATLEMPTDEQHHFRRRILKIKSTTIVGFSVAAHDLSENASLNLQAHGIGGRRVMGCGLFNPIASKQTMEKPI